MRRDQTAHERLIPLLVEIVGARSYVEFGTHLNETISKVVCEKRYGVDINAVPCEGAEMFTMTTQEFFETKAAALAPFDFCLIDADHNPDAVRRDFMGVWGFMADEGLVCIHDLNPQTIPDTAPGYCGEAWKFAMCMVNGGHEAVVLPYHPGLGIVRKRMKWGPVP